MHTTDPDVLFARQEVKDRELVLNEAQEKSKRAAERKHQSEVKARVDRDHASEMARREQSARMELHRAIDRLARLTSKET